MKGLLYKVFLAFAVLSALTFTACKHRPLVDMSNAHYVRVYIDEHLKNVTEGFYDEELERPIYQVPTVMRVMLCDPASGRMVAERYLQSKARDGRGYYLDGYIIAAAGDYDLMIYNFGTETTQLKDENNYRNISAYTNPISPMLYTKLPSSKAEFAPEDIRYDPDHLFVHKQERVHIPLKGHVDTLLTEQGDYFTAHSVVKSYYLQIRVRGVEHLRSAVSLLSGMSGSSILCEGRMNPNDPAVIYFEMKSGHRSKLPLRDPSKDPGAVTDPNGDVSAPTTEVATLYSTFNTFGKIDGVESIYKVTFEFVKTDGSSQTETLVITPLFYTPDAIDHQWILIDHEIEITPPEDPQIEGGGFTPGVEDWQDEQTDIII